MKNRTKVLASAITAALSLGLAGCITTSSPSPTPTPVVSESLTPSPTPTSSLTLSPEQEAAADAVAKFYEVTDQIASNDEVDLNSLYEVSGGELVQQYLKDLQMMRVQGWRQTGLTGVEVTQVTGLAEPFKVEACVDTSAIDVTDANGKSLVSPDGATRVLYRFDVVTLGSPVLRVTSAEVVQSAC